MPEFLAPAQLGAAELKFSFEQLFVFVFRFLFSVVEDFVILTGGRGCGDWVAELVCWVEGGG